MTTDALRRLQALRPTRTGSIPAVLAAVQGDLQTVIEAVLELAGCDDGENTPPASQNGPQEAPVDSQVAPGPQKSAGRIGWLRLDSSFPFRYLAREVEGGWSGVDLDHNNGVPGWTDTGYPEVTFTPLLDGFFVAPDRGGQPMIWRETNGGPTRALLRTPFNAAFFDAVAGLLETREEA